ncbi:MAG: cytochrome P450 [Gammaproteobacteria bacterium]|nr:cytochrome P450 [Gammaproteobacteria bacterium]MDE0286092.1 cytochrome P450 [Gammaproteobacteria bacterium]
MRFAEELLLLLHSDESGYFIAIPEWRMSCALAGSVLMNLAFENRIDTDLEALALVDATPTGDKMLDLALKEISREKKTHSPQFWVERIARHADDINETVINRLVKKGIFEADAGGFWSLSGKVSRSGRYPMVHGRTGEEIKGRIIRVLFDEEIPDPRDMCLISLVHNCGGFRAMLEPEEYELAEARIELFSGMDLIGRTIGHAVRSSYRPPESLRAVTGRTLPVLGLKDMLFSKAFREMNIPKFVAEKTREVGPVFKLKTPGREMVILAGAEMNRWVGRNGRNVLRTRDYLEGFQSEWGTARSIASMGGAEHFRMRKTVRAGNSRKVVEDRMGDLIALARRSFGKWGIGKVMPGEMACQRLIGDQIAQLSVSIEASEILDDLLKFEYRALLVHVMRLLPKFTLHTPRMNRYRKRVQELYAQIHASHTPAQREGKRRDLVDDLMELHHSDPAFLPETDLGFAFIAPIIAGHYTGSAMAFTIYEFFKHPHYAEQVTAEADALFADGDPVGADFTLSSIDVTHRFIMEVLRLHPVIPMHVRTAMNAFEVEGYQIPAYSTVMVAFSATHYMEDYFPDPEKLDIDRYKEPREEHKHAGANAYAPFGVGTHICGGARWTELQMAANILLIARHLGLELVPKDYKLRLSPLPKTSPDKRFKFRVTGHRHPIVPVT